MTRRSAGALPGRTLLAGALASLLAFLTLTAVVTRHGFDNADHLAREIVHGPSYPVLHSSMEAASWVGGRPGQIAVVCLGSALLWRRRRRWGLALPVVMAGAGLLQHVAKWAVDRPRPNLDPWGFPSGHVLTVVVLCGFIAYAVATSRARRSVRVGICAAIVGTVAFSRMYLDAHWFSDVLGGLSIGLAYLLAAIWLVGSVPALWTARAPRAARVEDGLPLPDIGEPPAEPQVAAMAAS